LSAVESRTSQIKNRLLQLEHEKQLLLDELKSLNVVDSMNLYGTPASDSQSSSAESRIALFSELFCCRQDVFPKLWENTKKGTKGYSPTCQNEWIQGVCNNQKLNVLFVQIVNLFH